ncbi:hypothetical protein MD484_g631, partial [Candolleomyces efflorescens]
MSLSMNDVDLTLSALPASSTILLSMVAVFVLLSFVRALVIGLREHLDFVKGRKAQQDTKTFSSPAASSSSPSSSEKFNNAAPRAQMEQRPTSSWLWGLIKWDTLPAFPLAPSLHHTHVSAGIGRGVGVGMSEKQGWLLQPQPQQAALQRPVLTTRRPGGPAFERPLPTLYQSEVPVSMAKMIMSRHVSPCFPTVHNASPRFDLPPTIITTATRKAGICPDSAPLSIGTIASSTSDESTADTHYELVSIKATITAFEIPITTIAFQ